MMPSTNSQPHANGGNDSIDQTEASNGAKADPAGIKNVVGSRAETELVLHYIGENYDSQKISNYDEINQFTIIADQFIRENTDEDTYNKLKSAGSPEDAEVQIETSTEDTWEKLDVVATVTDSQIGELLKRAANFHYSAVLSDKIDQDVHLMCATLFKKDYTCVTLSNSGGALCWNYPANITVPIGVKMNDPNSSNEDKFYPNTEVPGFLKNFKAYCETAESAAIARCRSRFPVPVILYNGKFICRSGTLAVRKGAAFEAFRKAPGQQTPLNSGYEPLDCMYEKSFEYFKKICDATSILVKGVEEMKTVDVSVLKMLKIKYICDLMVEDRKIHTGMSVSSSEKINLSKYGEFRCLRVPYPGCEFFRRYHGIRFDKDYEQLQNKLIFDWDAPEVNSSLGMSEEEKLPFPELKWDNYGTWDLETLTKNYLRLILYYVEHGDGGLLVHCISGWDRTPLFICLLRISLWADELIHKELDVDQMAYFTLGYDWYLFGHDLPNRLKKKEEIMHFCFKFLPCIASKEYSINRENDLISQICIDKFLSRRKDRIEGLSKKVLHFYEEYLTEKYFKGLENPNTPVDSMPVE